MIFFDLFAQVSFQNLVKQCFGNDNQSGLPLFY